jgi:GlpG protein
MRQLATLPDAGTARTLADYLLTQNIETRMLQEPDGWAVWVCDEDRLGQARQELADYQNNPHDPRFTTATRKAESVRQQRAQQAAAPRPARVRRPADLGGHYRVTALLITASVLASLFTGMGNFARSSLARDLAVAPLTAAPLVAGRDPLLWGLEHAQVWRLVTPIFLHLGIGHLVFNMIMLYQLGCPIEDRRGSWRFLLLVLACAIPSNLAQYYWGTLTLEGRGPVSPFFGGMSGVLYGLFGYIWMKSVFEPELGLGMHPSTVVILLGWFFLCWSPEFQKSIGPVANMAHTFGLLSGMVIALAPTVGRIFLGRGRHDG